MKKNGLLVVVILAMTAGILALDLSIPKGTAVGTLYVVPLLLSFRLPDRKYVILFAAAFTVLTVAGATWSPAGASLGYVVANRVFSLLSIWAAVLIYVQRSHARVHQRTSEDQLEGILLSSMDGIITIDEDQRITFFNPSAEQMFRCPAAEAIGQPIDKFIPELFRRAHREHIKAFGETNVTSRQMGALRVITGLRANGEEFPIEASISQIQTPSGKFYSVIHRDITERKRAEATLQESEALFASFMDHTHAVAWMKDEHGYYVYVNEPFESRFNRTLEEIKGKTDFELWPKQTAQELRANDQIVLSSGRSLETFETVPTPDGVPHYWLVYKFPFRDASDQQFVGGMAIDITERKRMEEQFRLAVESSPSGMLMVDHSGKILLVNEQVEQQFGYSREELIGQPVEILVPERYRAQHPEHRAHFFAAPATRQMGKGRDLYGRRKDGSEFRVEIGLNPIRTAEGVRVLASVVDITERKQIEERLRHTERLAELGTLASGMAHEIGTPMNVILGRAEYLMQRTNDEATRKGLSTIATQVERITKVMNQLLAIARRRPAERQAMNLRQTIEDSLEIVQERLARHRIQVEVAFADPVPTILADADQMSQVFLNLIMNAIHAMPEGGVLRVGLARADGRARITVADTGHGIPPEIVERIFDPFFTTKETGKGTGLGLTVVKGIIEEHGGSITAESEPGRGTTFTIELPISR